MTSDMHPPSSPPLPPVAVLDRDRPWLTLTRLAAEGDRPALLDAVHALSPGDAARAFAHLDTEETRAVLHAVGAEEAADLIEGLSRAQAVDIVEALEPAHAADILHELAFDTETDIVRDLDDDDAEAVLAALPADEAADVRALQRYEDDSAGGLMTPEVARIPEQHTVGEVIEHLRTHSEEYRDYLVQYVYVVDDDGRLRGVLRLRDLLLAPGEDQIVDTMILNPLCVEASAPLDVLEDIFDRVGFFALPVVDDGRLVGVLRRSVVHEALGEEAHRDHMKAAGIVGGEELRSMPLITRARRRLQWLSVNIGLNVIAASVIALYQDTLAAVIALAVFLPIISDMSGCSGNQAVAVSMRELSLGLVRPRDAVHVLLKEVSVGLINGLALGLLLGLVATLWQGNPYLGLVAGGALAINTVVAVAIGGTVPLILKGFGVDPALASGPVLTTITDLCGFLLVLGFATSMLPLLVTP